MEVDILEILQSNKMLKFLLALFCISPFVLICLLIASHYTHSMVEAQVGIHLQFAQINSQVLVDLTCKEVEK
jgi:hypothetical protein